MLKKTDTAQHLSQKMVITEKNVNHRKNTSKTINYSKTYR